MNEHLLWLSEIDWVFSLLICDSGLVPCYRTLGHASMNQDGNNNTDESGGQTYHASMHGSSHCCRLPRGLGFSSFWFSSSKLVHVVLVWLTMSTRFEVHAIG